MSRSPLALSFRMFHNDRLVREVTLAHAVIKIGKVPSAHLQIADDAVSRMHAIVEVTGREVSLIDLGSTRGTFVNGARIHKARLASGDAILIGDTRLELEIRDAAAVDAAAGAHVAGAHGAGAHGAGAHGAASSAEVPSAARASAVATSAAGTSAAGAHGAGASAAGTSAAVAHGAVASAGVASAAVAHGPPASALPASASPEIPAACRSLVADPADERGEARAVEVAALLGDSVVGVKHCIDPRGGRVLPVTWALVATAVVCLVASAAAFLASVRVAADNRARFDRWTRVEHKPAYGFRPHHLGAGADWFAFGGAGLALVGFTLGLMRMRRERVSPYYRIGTAPGVELAIDGAPAPAFPLVAPSGDGFVFHVAPGIDGELLRDGAATPLGSLAAAGLARPSASIPGALEVAIPRNARIRARVGPATVMVSAVAPPRRHAVPLFAGLERRTLAYVAGSLAVHLAIWGILQLLPPEATAISVELPIHEPVAVSLIGTSPEDPVAPASERTGEAGGEAGGATGDPAMALPAGAAGHPDATDAGQLRIARADAPLQLSRGAAIDEARAAGLLGNEQLLASVQMLAELPEMASGFDVRSFTGPMIGAYGGDGPGSFGGGLIGGGDGGGCRVPPCGLIPGGVRYATIHDGPGAGGGFGLPGRGIGNRGHEPSVPRIGAPELTGGSGYDKSLIRRYIRRSIDKIGYCYDKQLLAHPELGGSLAVTFFIAPSGGVQTASGTGFDREVATCVADVIRTIAFPRPGDGVGVQVHYPFQFHPAGR